MPAPPGEGGTTARTLRTLPVPPGSRTDRLRAVTAPPATAAQPESSQPAPDPDPLAPPDEGAARVEAVLDRVRAGVRQRQAELATLSGGEEIKLRLLELKTLEYVEEPLAYSPRPVVGSLLVFGRKAVFHLFVKWWSRPVLQRQNRFNQVASQLLHELAANQSRLAEALDRASRRLEALEPPPSPPPPEPSERSEPPPSKAPPV